MSFEELSLSEEINKALKSLNFNEPTEIQAKVIPVASQGRDLISCAETGSGKTAAYAIPLVTNILENPDARALILAPTRELAQQISEFIRELIAYAEGIRVISIVGGADIRKQLKNLKKNPQIVVATPGRLTDHLKRRSINLKETKHLVLDEGDRMLDMGFAPQIDDILKFMPEERQTMLFTATLPPKVKDLARRYLVKPERIQVGEISQPVKTVSQSVIQVKVREKDNRVVDELNKRDGSVIIFTKTKRRATQLTKHLLGFGFKADMIHGGRTQGQRNKAIRGFRDGESRILCATDVASRGIDVPQVAHVINFDLPMMREDYVHRIGRTARNGAKGEAVSFVTPNEHREWQAIAKEYRIKGVELEKVKFEPRTDHVDKRKGGRGRPQRDGDFKGKKPSFGRKKFGAKKRWSNEEVEERSARAERADRPEREESSDRPRKSYAKKKFSGKKRWESRDVEGAPGGKKKFGKKKATGKKTFGRKKFGASKKKTGGRSQSRPSF